MPYLNSNSRSSSPAARNFLNNKTKNNLYYRSDDNRSNPNNYNRRLRSPSSAKRNANIKSEFYDGATFNEFTGRFSVPCADFIHWPKVCFF